MKLYIDHKEILDTASHLIQERFLSFDLATGGVDHTVFRAKTKSGKNIIIKTGLDVANDVYVLKKLSKQDFKVPRLLAETKLWQNRESYSLLIMTCYEGAPLQSISPEEKFRYIPMVLEELRKLRAVKSPGRAGCAVSVAEGKDWSWKEFLLRNVSVENPGFDWKKILGHKSVHPSLVTRAISVAKEKIQHLDDAVELSLLHTDINEVNIFVKNGALEGIIDWSDAKYGDCIFDLARFRMNIEQKTHDAALREYYIHTKLSVEETIGEKTYFLLNVLDYINWCVMLDWNDSLLTQMQLLKKSLGDRGP